MSNRKLNYTDMHYGYMGKDFGDKGLFEAQRSALKELGLYGEYPLSPEQDIETFRSRIESHLHKIQRHKDVGDQQRARREARLDERAAAGMREKERLGHWRALPLDTPVRPTESTDSKSQRPCRSCKRMIKDHQESIAPRTGECIDCTRGAFEVLTSVKIPGGDSKRSETWKVDNLHLYLEQVSRVLAEGAERELVLRPFTIREFITQHGSKCYTEDCNRLWSGLYYLLAPAEGGSHSLENVRPACLEHMQEGGL